VNTVLPNRHSSMGESIREILIIGAVSSLTVAATAGVCGKTEGQSAWRPINAISHIVWGRKAAQKNLLTPRYTGVGLVLNGVACGFWAWLYRHCRRSMTSSDSFLLSVGSGIAISMLAYVTDYYVVPRRFTPGFELTLSRRSFPWLYGALAVGLFTGGRV
jgi:hypothetical protein